MFPHTNPTTTQAWKAIAQHAAQMKKVQMRDLFAQDKDRFNKYAISFNDTLFDLSKNIITDETMQLLLQLANECGLKAAIEAMFNGELINQTEHRSVLHIALRNFSGQPIYAEGKNVMDEVHKV